MHAVRCPNCRRTLRLDKAVQNARLRCRHCGHIFAGTSQEVAVPARTAEKRPQSPPLQTPPPLMAPPPQSSDPFPSFASEPAGPFPQAGPGPAAAPPGPPMAPYPVRKRPSVVPLIIVCVGFVAIIGASIGAYWLATHKQGTIRDTRGNILESGWWTEEERAAKEAEWKKRTGGDASLDGAEPAPLTPTTPRDVGPGAHIAPTPPGPAKPPGPAAAVVDPNDMVTGDPKLIATAEGNPVTRDETPASGWIVGTVENRYDHPIQVAKIAIYTYDVNDQRRPPFDGLCCFIPPGGTVRFSAKYRGLTKGHIYKIIAKAYSPARAAANVVSWAIPAEQTNRDNQGRSVIITGRVKNPHGFAVRNLKIHYDVYDAEGVQINETTKSAGKVPEALAAGGEGDFTITFSPSVTGYSIQMVRKWVIRVWAEK